MELNMDSVLAEIKSCKRSDAFGEQIHDIFKRSIRGKLKSFLIEITRDVFVKAKLEVIHCY